MNRRPASLQSTLNQLTKKGYRISAVEVAPDGSYSISTADTSPTVNDELQQARAIRHARQAHRFA